MEIDIAAGRFAPKLDMVQRGCGEFDALAVPNGKDDTAKEKTTVFHVWLLGYEFTDSLLVVTRKSFCFISSQKKVQLIARVKDQIPGVNFLFFTRDKDNKEAFQTIFKQIEKESSGVPKIGGMFKENHKGDLTDDWAKFLTSKAHVKVEAGSFITGLFLVKQRDQLEHCQRAAKVCGQFMRRLIKEVEDVIDGEKKQRHCDITTRIQKYVQSDTELQRLQDKLKLDSKAIGLPLNPVVQSGGNYVLKLNAQSNKEFLQSDTILLLMAAEYNQYNAICARTLLIDSSQEQKRTYKECEALFQVLNEALRPGAKLKDVFAKGAKHMAEKLPGLQLPSHFGAGVGLQLKEGQLTINDKNEKAVEAGMVFNLTIAINNIPDSKKPYALWVADTVIVDKDKNSLLTGDVYRLLNDISYSFNEEPKAAAPRHTNGEAKGSRRRPDAQINKNQAARNEHQTLLKKRKLEQIKARDYDFTDRGKKVWNMDFQKHQTYKSKEELPKELRKNIIGVDFKSFAVLLPICGQHLPIHVSLLKNISKIEEEKAIALRFNFHIPGASQTVVPLPKVQERTLFVKELTFRSENKARMNETFKRVKDLQKKLKQHATEEGMKEQLVEQEKIILSKTKRPQLKDLVIRPNITQKKTVGVLDCHVNGFRFSSNRGEVVDVAFSNIKHAFFQPCAKEIIAAVHFNLRNPVLINKKKVEDVQFYMESGQASEEIDGRRKGDLDDEDDEEEKERAMKRKIDREIEGFCKACQQFSSGAVSFQTPKRQLGFLGTPFRSASLLQPTKSCLINLIDQPFFVMQVSKVEVAVFERMIANVRNFDLTFVFRDYETNIRVQSIPIDSLEKIKDWLDSSDIIFYEIQKNLTWATFLSSIRKDFQKFVEDGAWTAWDSDDEDGEEEEGGEDSAFEIESVEEDDSESESESNYEEDEDEESGSYSEESLSEEGLDSEEMDEEFQKMDRKLKLKEAEKENKARKKK